jgi:hypothetical protein
MMIVFWKEATPIFASTLPQRNPVGAEIFKFCKYQIALWVKLIWSPSNIQTYRSKENQGDGKFCIMKNIWDKYSFKIVEYGYI